MGEGNLDGFREEVITHLPPQSIQLMASSLTLTSIGFVCFGEEKVLGVFVLLSVEEPLPIDLVAFSKWKMEEEELFNQMLI